MPSIQPRLPRSCIKTVDSAEDFINYLLPSSVHWRSAKRGDLAYRGQASSGWRLVPKAFRKDEPIGYGGQAPVANPTRVVPQARAEFGAVQQFVRAADGSGLKITEGSGRLLLQEDARDIFGDRNWEYGWPQDEILDALALAQHHGVPTRLLDFTEDPLIAAFFAASFAIDRPKRGKGRQGTYLTVWVIDLRIVRALNRIRSRYPERVGEIRVPRADNAYLHAQSAFFLIDRGANDLMAKRELHSMDQTVIDRANHWHTGDRLAGRKITQTWFHKLPVKQVRLKRTFAKELLRELEDRGVTKGTVMPSLDSVVESLLLQGRIV